MPFIVKIYDKKKQLRAGELITVFLLTNYELQIY